MLSFAQFAKDRGTMPQTDRQTQTQNDTGTHTHTQRDLRNQIHKHCHVEKEFKMHFVALLSCLFVTNRAFPNRLDIALDDIRILFLGTENNGVKQKLKRQVKQVKQKARLRDSSQMHRLK